jgi:hypothetical protein
MPELVALRLYVSALVAAALATGAVILSRVNDAARAIPTGR